MTFEKTDEHLDELIGRVMTEDPQLTASLRNTGFEGHDINDELRPQRDIIWEIVVDEIKRHELALRHLEDLRNKLSAEAGPEPVLEDVRVGPFETIIPIVGGLYVVVLIAWAAIGFARGWRPGLARLLTAQGAEFTALVIAPVFVWGALLTWMEARRGRIEASRRDQHAQQIVRWTAQREDLASQLGVVSLVKTIEAQEAEIEKLLLERVQSAMMTAINQRLAPSYAPLLDIKKPRGFGEVFDQRLTIVTPARSRLEFLLRSMPGGSIGIAGSRGAGKTTLLKLFSGPKRVIEQLNGKPVLGVLVSAPVAYQARDFILYLFTMICQNVIEAEGGKYKLPGAPEDAPPSDPLDAPLMMVIKPLPTFLIQMGIVLTVISLMAAIILAAAQTAQPTTTPAPAAAAGPAPKPTTAAPSPATASAPPPQPVPAPRPTPAPVTIPAANDFGLRVVNLLKLDPATWLAWGVASIVLGMLLAKGLRRGPWRTLLIAVGRMMHATIGRLPPYGDLTRRFLNWQYGLANDQSSPSQRFGSQTPPPPSELRDRAESWLKAIKFQQSYTSGWSGSLKLPIGIEGGVNRAVTLAQNQLSLPEVVQFLSRFIDEISLKYQVIIGIDEMDKLASDALAQRFLNDIKSIFDLERCFYLISVSENAMSNFERRGLPFRDVFDSSFDDFVYVDYLDFTTAQELLQQRVVGRAVPFFAMSYCMSGGLPRDLIRNFRSVLEVHGQTPPRDKLSDICKTLVENDLRAKVRATRTTAKKIKLEAKVDRFLEVLYELEQQIGSDALLIDSGSKLLRVAANLREDVVDKEHVAMAEQLANLSEELGTYVFCATTVRQFFTDEITKQQITASVPGDLDSLAKARQVLGVNPAVTRILLSSFRTAHAMPLFPYSFVLNDSAPT